MSCLRDQIAKHDRQNLGLGSQYLQLACYIHVTSSRGNKANSFWESYVLEKEEDNNRPTPVWSE
jgi:hypothetical protein